MLGLGEEGSISSPAYWSSGNLHRVDGVDADDVALPDGEGRTEQVEALRAVTDCDYLYKK